MKSLEVRFWEKVACGKPTECWEWSGSQHGGYGRFKMAGKTMIATRVAYWLATGVHPGNLLVMHTCDNPKCCNPSHLRLGTNSDNTKDKVEKGRLRIPDNAGESNGNSLLTDTLVTEMRVEHKEGKSIAEIARQFNVPYVRAYGAITGDRWGKNPDYKKRQGNYAKPTWLRNTKPS